MANNIKASTPAIKPIKLKAKQILYALAVGLKKLYEDSDIVFDETAPSEELNKLELELLELILRLALK